MRSLIFGTVLIALASFGFNHVVSAALIAARDAKAATFLSNSPRCSQRLRADRRKSLGCGVRPHITRMGDPQ